MKPAKENKPVLTILKEHARTYCETTTVHGFAYWTTAPRTIERVLWVAVVLLFGTYASTIISAAVKDWMDDPIVTTIKTFSKPVSEVDFPAVTLCPVQSDTGEWTRAVLNNLEYDMSLRIFGSPFLGEQVAGGEINKVVSWAKDVFSEFYIYSDIALWDIAVRGKAKEIFEGFENVFYSEPQTGTETMEEIQALKARLYAPSADDCALAGELTPGQTEFLKRLEKAVGVLPKTLWFTANCVQWYPDNETDIFAPDGCFTKDYNATEDVVHMIAPLSPFDRFVFDKLVRSGERVAEAKTNGKLCAYSEVMERSFNEPDITEYCSKPGSYFGSSGEIKCDYDTVRKIALQLKGIRFMLENAEREWPLSDMGSLLNDYPFVTDYTYGRHGHLKISSFALLSRAIFNRSNADLNFRFKWRPEPARIGRLFSLDNFDYFFGEDPSAIVEDLTTEQLARLLEFGTLAEHELETGKFASMEELLRNELKVFEANGYKSKKSLELPKFAKTILSLSNPALESRANLALTDFGLCTVVNGASMENTFVENNRTKTFTKTLLGKQKKNGSPKKIKGSGGLHKTTFWVNVQNPTQKYKKGIVKAALNDWKDFFSVRAQDLTIMGGNSYRLKVKPTVHDTTDHFKALSLDTRRCRPNHETDPDEESIFSSYRFKSCVLNCMLRNLTCLPWDYPLPVDGHKRLPNCHAGGKAETSLKAFHGRMNDVDTSEQCESICLPNCEETTYEYGLTVTPLNTIDLCVTGTETRKMAIDLWNSTSTLLGFLSEERQAGRPASAFDPGRHYDDVGYDARRKNLDEQMLHRICHAYFERHIAEVVIEIATPTVLEIVKDIKVTFPGMLGTVGGTIGLFTGLSLISVVEAVYWVYRALVEALSGAWIVRK